jgi:hypothetical protein
MMNPKTKKVILLTLISLLIAAAVASYFYNKGPVDVSDEKGIAVEAAVLYQEYINDTAIAGSKYGGKIVEVSGEIQEVRKTSEQERVVLLKSGVEGAYINCSMQAGNEVLPESGKVVIKGICDGILLDDDLGIPGDVIVKRSVIKN